jgi:hypothetical protein
MAHLLKYLHSTLEPEIEETRKLAERLKRVKRDLGSIASELPSTRNGQLLTVAPSQRTRSICNKHIEYDPETDTFGPCWMPALTAKNSRKLQNFFKKHADAIHLRASRELKHTYLPGAVRVLRARKHLLDAGHHSMVYLHPNPQEQVGGTTGSGSTATVYEYRRNWERDAWPPFHAFSTLSTIEQSEFVSPKALGRTLYRWVERLPSPGICGAMSAHTHVEWEWGDTDEYKLMVIQLEDSITLPVLKYEERAANGRLTGEEVIFPGTLRFTQKEDDAVLPRLRSLNLAGRTAYYTHTSAGVYVGIANDCGQKSYDYNASTFLIVAKGSDAIDQIDRVMRDKHEAHATCAPPPIIRPPSTKVHQSSSNRRLRTRTRAPVT